MKPAGRCELAGWLQEQKERKTERVDLDCYGHFHTGLCVSVAFVLSGKFPMTPLCTFFLGDESGVFV